MTDRERLATGVADQLFELYSQRGHEAYGEQVTMLMHMMQAALIAEQSGFDDEMILAAFLHDIGHFFEGTPQMGIYGTQAHDVLGNEYLIACGFPDRMGQLVASHVAAKRYLTWSDSAYYDTLSEASKVTLHYQGGPMNETEATAFRNHPYFEKFIQLRIWDDMGKEAGIPVLPADIARMREKTVRYLLEYGNLQD